MSFLDELKGALSLGSNIRALMFRALITDACFSMFYVVWQPFLLDLGSTLPQLGLVQGVMTLFAAVGSLLWGRIADVYGRKPAIVASVLCRLSSLLFCVFAKSWVSFIGFGALMGLSATWEQTNPAVSALVSESVDEDRVGMAMSVIMSLGMLASISTASLGGYLALNNGYGLIFTSCIAGELIIAVLLTLCIDETLVDRNRAKETGSLFDELTSFLSIELRLLPLYVVSILGTVSYGMSNSILYGLLVDSLGFNTVQLGLMSTIFGLSWGLSQIPVGSLMDRHGRKIFMILSQVSFIVVMLGYILVRDFGVFLVLQAISGLGYAMWVPAYIAVATSCVPEERRSLAMGKLSTLPLLLGIPAPVVGGIVYEPLGFGAPLIIRLFALLVSAVVIFIFVKERREAASQPGSE
jgi:MFS family permease